MRCSKCVKLTPRRMATDGVEVTLLFNGQNHSEHSYTVCWYALVSLYLFVSYLLCCEVKTTMSIVHEYFFRPILQHTVTSFRVKHINRPSYHFSGLWQMCWSFGRVDYLDVLLRGCLGCRTSIRPCSRGVNYLIDASPVIFTRRSYFDSSAKLLSISF